MARYRRIKKLTREPPTKTIFDLPSDEYRQILLSLDSRFYSDIEYLSDEIKINVLRKDSDVIKFLSSPSPEMQRLAVGYRPDSILYIEEPTEEVLLIAAPRIPRKIAAKFGEKHLSEKVQMILARTNGLVLENMPYASEKVKLAALKNYGRAIRYVENPTIEMQKVAIKQSAFAVKGIKNPSEEMMVFAIQKDTKVFRHLENPSEYVHQIFILEKLRKA